MTVSEPTAPNEEPILRRLREVGYDVHSLAGLRHSGERYRDAIPILIAALSELSDEKTLTEVVRALTVPWARPAATGPLIELFREVEDHSGLGLRWVIGNALDVVWSDDYFDDLVNVARDREFGRAREMVVLGFARSKRSEAGGVLLELLDDLDVNGHAVKALRTLKIPSARPGLEGMLDDKRVWVRNEAHRALAALQ